MCRALAYSGHGVVVDDLLFQPDSSLVRQSYAPQQLAMLNLGGFGMIAWDAESARPELPWLYRSTELPIFDRNLKALAEKARTTCMLAHVRGIPYRADAGFGPHNLHPFRFDGQRWAMAHNGDLQDHQRMRSELLAEVSPALRQQVQGTTDSETVYALVMHELSAAGDDSPDALVAALARVLERLKAVRRRHGVELSSSLNLFFADGESLVALRYTFDFGCYTTADPSAVSESSHRYLSLWYTVGERYSHVDGEWQMCGSPNAVDSVLVASEPLTRNILDWVEVPEYAVLIVDGRAGRTRLRSVEVE